MIVHVVPDTRVANAVVGVVGVGRDDEPALEDAVVTFTILVFGRGSLGGAAGAAAEVALAGVVVVATGWDVTATSLLLMSRIAFPCFFFVHYVNLFKEL